MTKTVVVFRSSAFDLSWPKDVNPKEGDPWGRDCADFLAKQLAKNGIEIVGSLFWGEGGWYLDVKSDGTAFRLFVHWVPLGDPPRDFWAVQIQPKRGLLTGLFGKKDTDTTDRALGDAIDRALASDVRTSDVRWMTRDEFAAVY